MMHMNIFTRDVHCMHVKIYFEWHKSFIAGLILPYGCLPTSATAVSLVVTAETAETAETVATVVELNDAVRCVCRIQPASCTWETDVMRCNCTCASILSQPV